MYKTILFEVKDHIAKVSINRPHVQNALEAKNDMRTYQELHDVFTRCDKDPDIRAVVLTGVGKHFSAGGDIAEFKADIENGTYIPEYNVRITGNMAAAIRHCRKPTIAMVNGTAAGAGMAVAMACDFRIMATNSKLNPAFIRMGLSGDTGAMFNLAQCVGPTKALEYMMLGDPIGAEAAYQCGLAYRVCEPEMLEEETNKLAARLAKGPTYAYGKQKELMYGSYYGGYEGYLNTEITYMRNCSLTEDFAEAVNAFLEKRKPEFAGK